MFSGKNWKMKKIISIALVIALAIFFLSLNKVKKYNYLKSDEFVSDMAALEFCVLGYMQSNNNLPANFNEFLPEGEKLLPDDHPNKPSKKFYKLNIKFLQKDSIIVIYLDGFDGDELKKNKNVRNISILDTYFYNGDFIVDTLVEAPNFFENGPPPKVLDLSK
jgi:hypothetical protein